MSSCSCTLARPYHCGPSPRARAVFSANVRIREKTDRPTRLETALKRDYTRKISTSQLITVPAHNMDVPSLLLMEDRLTHAQEQLADTEIQLKQKCDVVLLLKQELKRAKAQVRTSA